MFAGTREERSMSDEPTTPEAAPKPFEASKYIRKIKGGDYLEVKWRIVWFRSEFPNGRIVSELLHHGDHQAVFRATVENGHGGVATGHGTEEIDHFQDYLEKAETKAIGRALAALGYGTQFCYDFADGDGPIADAPLGK